MTNKNKGLKMAEKIIFVLAAALYFVSSFLSLTGSGASSSSVSPYPSSYSVYSAFSTAALLLSVFGWALMALGFVVVLFYPKKYVIGVALFVAQPIYLLSYIISVLTSSSSVRFGIGAILFLVAVVLTIVSIVLHSIASLIDKTVEDEEAVEKRINVLKAYKEYKDEGIITEEEFQMKKNEILGLRAKKEEKK